LYVSERPSASPASLRKARENPARKRSLSARAGASLRAPQGASAGARRPMTGTAAETRILSGGLGLGVAAAAAPAVARAAPAPRLPQLSPSRLTRNSSSSLNVEKPVATLSARQRASHRAASGLPATVPRRLTAPSPGSLTRPWHRHGDSESRSPRRTRPGLASGLLEPGGGLAQPGSCQLSGTMMARSPLSMPGPVSLGGSTHGCTRRFGPNHDLSLAACRMPPALPGPPQALLRLRNRD
jgi:hypothetical protein